MQTTGKHRQTDGESELQKQLRCIIRLYLETTGGLFDQSYQIVKILLRTQFPIVFSFTYKQNQIKLNVVIRYINKD